MGTITIGGRALDVRPATLGFVKRALLPWKRAVPKVPPGADLTIEQTTDLEAATIDWMAAGLLLYVGHNDGVTAEWVLENVVDAAAALRAAQAAAGQETSASGEAARP